MTQLKNILHVPSDAGADPNASAKAVFETVLRNDLRVQAVTKALFSGAVSYTHLDVYKRQVEKYPSCSFGRRRGPEREREGGV